MRMMADVLPAPGELRSPALALANSRHNSPGGMVDHLEGSAQAASWLLGRGLLAGSIDISENELGVLHALRVAVRELLVARLTGGVPGEDAVHTLNRVAGTVPGSPRLCWTVPGEPQAQVQATAAPPLSAAMATIAADAIDLLCSDRAGALWQCEAPGCVRLMERDHARRRWCSNGCGDRVRAARYYARHRTQGEP